MKKRISILFLFIILSVVYVKAEDIGINFNGAITINQDTKTQSQKYSSTQSNQAALLIHGTTSTINSSSFTKTGDSQGELAEKYGINSALVATNEAIVNLNNATVNTNGKYANGIFSYKVASINVNNSNIVTNGLSSSGLMTAESGKIVANKDNVTTKEAFSPAIKSGIKGGTIAVESGNYKTEGTNSPVVYSQGIITTESANLASLTSEGIVIEETGSVAITNTNVTSNNKNSTGNIYIYSTQELNESPSSFKSTESQLKTTRGDTILVRKNNSEIVLENSKIENADAHGSLLRATNESKVKLTLSQEDIQGDIAVDKDSIVYIFVSTHSLYKGTFNKDNNGTVNLQVSSESNIILQGDSYVNSLDNADKNNNNIYANGHKLFVNGKEAKINPNEFGKKIKEEKVVKKDYTMYYYIGGGVLVFLLFIIIIVNSKKKAKKKEEEAIVQKPMMDTTPKSVNDVYKNMK